MNGPAVLPTALNPYHVQPTCRIFLRDASSLHLAIFMKPVEQAIFTSVETHLQSGYQLVSCTAGICPADACELVTWGPLHDSMLDVSSGAESFNFHPLPSGNYCVSRTTPAGWDSHGAHRVYTHCMIVSPELLGHFANNPLALASAVSERGRWCTPDAPGLWLEPFLLPGGAVPVDEALLRQMAENPGPEHMASLVRESRNAVCLAVAGARQPVQLIAGLLSCLPPECRLEFSFSTGLKFSPRRPFRIVVLSDDPAEQLWAANYPNVTVLKLDDECPTGAASADGWSELIERTLATERIPFLASQLSKRRFDLSLDDLPALGLQLLEMLDAVECHGAPAGPQTSSVRPQQRSHTKAHAPHRQFGPGDSAAAALADGPSSTQTGLHPPEVLEKLERLDDLVYEAISGQTNSLEQLQTAWPQLLEELDETSLAESREQYLRYALSIWGEYADSAALRDPARAIQALEVLSLLFNDVK